MIVPSPYIKNHGVIRPPSPQPSTTVHHEFRLRSSSTNAATPQAYQARISQMANLVVQLPSPPAPYGSVLISKFMLTKTPTDSDVARQVRERASGVNSRP